MPSLLAPAASTATAIRGRLPVGAEPTDEGTSFRICAPARIRFAVVIEAGGDARNVAHDLAPEADGYFSGEVTGIGAGARYWLRLDGERTIPDPVSRFPPAGPEGPSAG